MLAMTQAISSIRDSDEKYKNCLRYTLNFLGFFCLLLWICIQVTWLFRGNGIESRTDIVGFANEGNVDIVLYGGSDILRFYQPMMGWEEKGILSYNYGTSSARPDLIPYYIQESRLHSNPSLYIIDIRAITLLMETVDENVVRNWSDSLSPFSTIRNKGIASYIYKREHSDVDVLSYYVDIIRYHENFSALQKPDQWKFMDRGGIENIDRGFNPYVITTEFSQPDRTSVRVDLTDRRRNVLNDIIDYCKAENLNVLFTCIPFIPEEGEFEQINTCRDIIESNGYPFLDCNDYYGEIGIVFSHDFFDVNHLNYFGSCKFTRWFLDYLDENYDIEDHRGEEEYSQWELDWEEYEEMMSEWEKETRDNQIVDDTD